MKKRIIRIAVFFLLVISLFVFCGCASCERSFKSCNADISGGLYRTVNVYSLDGKLLATVILYEPEWRENRRASLRTGKGGVEEDGNSESNT